jgi:hypothetical protein
MTKKFDNAVTVVRQEIFDMWRDYTALNAGPILVQGTNYDVQKILQRLKTATMGRGFCKISPVHFSKAQSQGDDGTVATVNIQNGWKAVIEAYSWQWANEHWTGSHQTFEWRYYTATVWRKASKIFLARGMYLPFPTEVIITAKPDKAELRENKIRRLNERLHQWEKKQKRAEREIVRINRALWGYKLADIRKDKVERERKADEAAAAGGAGRNGGTGGPGAGGEGGELNHCLERPRIH